MLWHSLEEPQQGASNEYHNICLCFFFEKHVLFFFSKKKKKKKKLPNTHSYLDLWFKHFIVDLKNSHTFYQYANTTDIFFREERV